MKVSAYRIIKPVHLDNAFAGEGAQKTGGRWNSKGTYVVYCSGSLSRAALEILVHLESTRTLNTYLYIPIEFDSKLVLKIKPEDLPDDWQSNPIPFSTMAIGDNWVSKGDSVILEVPSVIIPMESNFILNPLHPDFKKIQIGAADSFSFDDRLANR